MCVHLGTNPFDVDPVDHLIIPPNDQTRLKFLGGGVPLALIVWGGAGAPDAIRSWRWLHDHGHTQVMARLYAKQGSLPPDPADYVNSMVEPFQDLETALIGAKCQLLNEWNNEYPSYSMDALVDWGTVAMDQFYTRLPSKRLYMPSPAQDNHFVEYVNGLVDLYEHADGIAIHYYFGRHAGDMEPGYEGSPEWWHARYPNKPLWITECANWTNRDAVQAVYARWARLPYVEAFADWKMSGPNDAAFNWSDSHCNTMAAVCKDWRAVRSYPPGTTAPAPPPVTPPGGVDVAGVLTDLDNLWGMATRCDQAINSIVSAQAALGEAGNSIRERVIGIKMKVTQ